MKDETETGEAGWKNARAWRRAFAWTKRENARRNAGGGAGVATDGNKVDGDPWGGAGSGEAGKPETIDHRPETIDHRQGVNRG